VTVPALLSAYLEDLNRKRRFGTGKPEIIRGFVWKEVNRLIEVGMLKERAEPDPAPKRRKKRTEAE